MLYHGTCADNLDSILKIGLAADEFPEKHLWTVSEGFNYFWDEEYFQEEYNEGARDAIFNAADNASSSLYSSKDCRRIIIEVDKAELDEKFLEEDLSCDNMQGALRYLKRVPPELISRIKIDKHDLSIFRLHFLAMRLEPHRLSIPPDAPACFIKIAKSFKSYGEEWDCLNDFIDEMETIYQR